MEVAVIRWPSQRSRRARLRREHLPRLLLVEDGAPLPEPTDCLEDWIRLPADDGDLEARVCLLRARTARHEPGRPELDDQGVLRMGDAWVALPPVEARLTAALLARWGVVVRRDALARAGWPGGLPGRNALDVHMMRLRRRFEALGLVLHTVRARGYLLDVVSDLGQTSAQRA